MYSWHGKLVKVLDAGPFSLFTFIQRLKVINVEGEFEMRKGVPECADRFSTRNLS